MPFKAFINSVNLFLAHNKTITNSKCPHPLAFFILLVLLHIRNRRRSCTCCPSRVWGLRIALLVWTSNANTHADMHSLWLYTLRKRLLLLCFWTNVERLRSFQTPRTKRLVTPIPYTIPAWRYASLPRKRCKCSNFILESQTFWRKSYNPWQIATTSLAYMAFATADAFIPNPSCHHIDIPY